MIDPRHDPVVLTLEEAESELGNDVYAATELIERLEGAGLIDGNGHHIRQQISRFATELMKQRWRKK